MLTRVRVRFALSVVLGLAAVAQAQSPAPPLAVRVPKVLELHGVRRADDYDWMRDKADPRLASYLDRRGLEAVAIHSDRTQPERTRALEGFKNGTIRVLVATDVAARGLDIEDLPHVVNFELPWQPQDYIHRIGRTGRAGQTGDAVSLVTIDEADLLRGVQRLLKRAIPWTVEEGFVPERNAEPQPLRGPQAADGHARREHHYPHRSGTRAGGRSRTSSHP